MTIAGAQTNALRASATTQGGQHCAVRQTAEARGASHGEITMDESRT